MNKKCEGNKLFYVFSLFSHLPHTVAHTESSFSMTVQHAEDLKLHHILRKM